jgi:hypothetical protein
MAKKARARILTVEMMVCWGSGTWEAEYFVEIPADTPEDQIEAVAAAVMLERLERRDAAGQLTDSVAAVHLYSYSGDDIEERSPMSGAEFQKLLETDRQAAIRAFCEAWLDANSEDRDDTVDSLASLVTHQGAPRLDLGTDEDLCGAYDEIVGNDPEEAPHGPS